MIIIVSYNALERRDACKGGKEAHKRGGQSQTSAKGAAASQRSHSSHTARRNDVPPSVNSTSQSGKTSRPASSGGPAPPVYDEQVLLVSGAGVRILLMNLE